MRFNWRFIVLRPVRGRQLSRYSPRCCWRLASRSPDSIWQKIVLAGTAVFGLIGVFLPELASPVSTDMGAARTAAGQSLLSAAQPPFRSDRHGARRGPQPPVHIIGDKP